MRPFRFDQPIATARLTLRPIAMDDFDDVHAYMSRADVAAWLPEDAYTLCTSRRRHPTYVERVTFEHDGDLILVAVEFDGRVIGDLDLTARGMEEGLVEIGWRLHPDHQGSGFATEAAAGLLECAFHDIGARRTVANLDARNTGSSAVCRRLGMRREAHHLQDTRIKGAWIDTLTYAVLATEWSSPVGRR